MGSLFNWKQFTFQPQMVHFSTFNRNRTCETWHDLEMGVYYWH